MHFCIHRDTTDQTIKVCNCKRQKLQGLTSFERAHLRMALDYIQRFRKARPDQKTEVDCLLDRVSELAVAQVFDPGSE